MTVPDRVLDAGRFPARAKWLVVGALVVLWVSARYTAIPEIWSLLDRAEMLGAAAASGTPSAEAGDGAYTKVYTAAYAVSLAPAVAGVGSCWGLAEYECALVCVSERGCARSRPGVGAVLPEGGNGGSSAECVTFTRGARWVG
ncbi:hypothetical protein OH738_18700 [Streptomyces hirsutus]|uniref:Uncharacterized protein n=1 Tax=Streptomyces hirsutus TaxID=35620 RepID=A0ABZ1GP17_9ACTN|nr:hypothetical protein [Streptomyces hirsutus]WSD07932.1 hypothetical protein OIE73_20795 [Streptomyces hirsutus]WTD18623.1 hypothetical protein OH738_18700 [Streptomyces hirsutus]